MFKGRSSMSLSRISAESSQIFCSAPNAPWGTESNQQEEQREGGRKGGSLLGSRHWTLKKKTNGLVLFCLYIVTTPACVASMLQVIGGWSHRANQLLSGPEQTLYRWTGSGDSLASQACRHLIPMWFWLTSTYTQNSKLCWPYSVCLKCAWNKTWSNHQIKKCELWLLKKPGQTVKFRDVQKYWF